MSDDYVLGGRFTPNAHKSRILPEPDGMTWTPHWAATSRTLWLVPDNSNASHIWCSGGEGSRGLGGNNKAFPLTKAIGGFVTLNGPWHANPTDLFKETGIDLRHNLTTWGVLGRGFTHDSNSGRDVITDLVYIDATPMPGTLDRIEATGRAMMEQNGEPQLYFYSESYGGCGYGMVQHV